MKRTLVHGVHMSRVRAILEPGGAFMSLRLNKLANQPVRVLVNNSDSPGRYQISAQIVKLNRRTVKVRIGDRVIDRRLRDVVEYREWNRL